MKRSFTLSMLALEINEVRFIIMEYCELMMVFRFNDRNMEPCVYLKKILQRGFFYNSSSTSISQHLELSFLIADDDQKLEVTNYLIDQILQIIPDSELVSMSTIKSVAFNELDLKNHSDDRLTV